MLTKWTVILERAPGRPDTRFEPESGHRAFDRAHALCELHGCQFTQDDKARTLTVHAGKYYKRPDERIRPERTPAQERLSAAYHERGLEDRTQPISKAEAYFVGTICPRGKA